MRHEDLPAHALPRAFVERVGNDADDLDRQLGLRPTAPPETFADGARPLEEVLGETAIDDRHGGVLLEVHPREIAAFEERNLHRLEVAGRQRVHERLHVFAIRSAVPLDRHGAVPLVAAQNGHGSHAGRRDARRRAQALEQTLIELHSARTVVAVERRRQLKSDEVVERHSRVGPLQILEAADEEPGAEEQQETERDLRGRPALSAGRASRRCRRSSPPCPSTSSTDRAGSRAAPAAGRRRCLSDTSSRG